MAKYKLRIVFENKDLGETDVRFDDVLNNKDAVLHFSWSKISFAPF